MHNSVRTLARYIYERSERDPSQNWLSPNTTLVSSKAGTRGPALMQAPFDNSFAELSHRALNKGIYSERCVH